MASALARKLRKLREENEFTLKDVADELDITPGAVAHWESGRSEPRADKLRALADVFNTSVEELRSVGPNQPRARRRDDVNAEVDAILADAERRIAALIGRPPAQVTVSYTYVRR